MPPSEDLPDIPDVPNLTGQVDDFMDEMFDFQKYLEEDNNPENLLVSNDRDLQNSSSPSEIPSNIQLSRTSRGPISNPPSEVFSQPPSNSSRGHIMGYKQKQDEHEKPFDSRPNQSDATATFNTTLLNHPSESRNHYFTLLSDDMNAAGGVTTSDCLYINEVNHLREIHPEYPFSKIAALAAEKMTEGLMLIGVRWLCVCPTCLDNQIQFDLHSKDPTNSTRIGTRKSDARSASIPPSSTTPLTGKEYFDMLFRQNDTPAVNHTHDDYPKYDSGLFDPHLGNGVKKASNGDD
ncbi:hypothetical protein HYFRA_00008543 [Hymenoscyphus fraxineus]|uniref:Uncharacterized protein n=1 Tax=Hymenoscyphus fraxineus TaxID=746836 RepID=A0A9N9KZK7_9HELO|nr:hypothetical protein HYFRA_00008543 [Hymenoscyphus fraxineus]